MMDRLSDDDIERLEMTDIGRRAAAEIRTHRASEPGLISLVIGFVMMVVIGLAALSIALRNPPPCPIASQPASPEGTR
jgi:hypothetical protein